MNTIKEATVDNVSVRLVERNCSDFVILYLKADDLCLASISHRTTDRAEAHKWFATAIDIAGMGFVHPAWQSTNKRIHINIGE